MRDPAHSRTSQAEHIRLRREMFEAVDAVLRRNPEVGAYNQKI
ncbi:hypothetical protein [Mesorhizobium sp. M1088]